MTLKFDSDGRNGAKGSFYPSHKGEKLIQRTTKERPFKAAQAITLIEEIEFPLILWVNVRAIFTVTGTVIR